MRAFIRPESCSVPHTSDRINLTRPAPARFGNRRRQRAAQGRCYACGNLARGVAPVDARTGGPWRRKQAPALRPACSRHAWAEFAYQGAKRPPASCEAPEAPIYLARSDRQIARALSAGFEVYRHDTGERVCAGCGPREARQYWHPLTGFEIDPRPDFVAAILATENGVLSGETSDASCGMECTALDPQYVALELQAHLEPAYDEPGPSEEEIVAAYADFEAMREAHVEHGIERAMAANTRETAFTPAVVVF